MTYQLFLNLYSEALSYDTMEMFIAERGWQDWMDNYTPEKAANMLQSIYTLANSSLLEIRQSKGMSRAKFSKDYLVPTRTIENWESNNSNKRTAPVYVEILIKYAIFESDQYESNE